MDRVGIPVACTLGEGDATAQLAEWSELVGRATSVARIEGGAVMTFPPALAERVGDLAAREAACCAFLSITTEHDDATLRLRITSAAPEAQPIIETLAGLGSR